MQYLFAQVETQVDDAEEEISCLMLQLSDLDLNSYESNPELLVNFVRNFRTSSRSFEYLVKKYAKKLSAEGCFTESNEAISLWSEKSDKIALLKRNLNGILG